MDTFNKIRAWASDRNLIEGSNSHSQMLKMTEEVGELANAIGKQNEDKLIDAIGDCVVVLTILAAQNKLSIEGCIDAAYNEIKDRKGKMINGVFVKEVVSEISNYVPNKQSIEKFEKENNHLKIKVEDQTTYIVKET